MLPSYGSMDSRFMNHASSYSFNQTRAGNQWRGRNQGLGHGQGRVGNQRRNDNQESGCNQGRLNNRECRGNQECRWNQNYVDKQGHKGNQDHGDKQEHEGDQDHGDKPGHEGNQDHGDKQGLDGNQDYEDKQGHGGSQGDEDKQGREGHQDHEDKQGHEGNQDHESSQEKEVNQGCEDDNENDDNQRRGDNQEHEGNQGRVVQYTYNHLATLFFLAVAPVAVYALLMINYRLSRQKAQVLNKSLCECMCVIYYGASLVMIVFIIVAALTNNRLRVRANQADEERIVPTVVPDQYCQLLNFRSMVFIFLFAISMFQIICSSKFLRCAMSVTIGKLIFCILQLALIVALNVAGRQIRSYKAFGQYMFAIVWAGNACFVVEFVGYSNHLKDLLVFMTRPCDLFYIGTVHFSIFSTYLIYTLLQSEYSETENDDIENIIIVTTSTEQACGSINSNGGANTRSACSKALYYLAETLRVVSNNSLFPSVVFSIFLLVTDVDAKANLAYHSNFTHPTNHISGNLSQTPVLEYVRTCSIYVRGAVALILFVVSTYEKPNIRKVARADRITLLLAVAFLLICYIVEIICDSTNFAYLPSWKKPIFFIQVIFKAIELYCQTYFILKASSFQFRYPLSLRQIFIRGTTKFVCVINLVKWLDDSMLVQSYFSQSITNERAFFHWMKMFQPVASIAYFYRLFSALLCYEILQRIPGQ